MKEFTSTRQQIIHRTDSGMLLLKFKLVSQSYHFAEKIGKNDQCLLTYVDFICGLHVCQPVPWTEPGSWWAANGMSEQWAEQAHSIQLLIITGQQHFVLTGVHKLTSREGLHIAHCNAMMMLLWHRAGRQDPLSPDKDSCSGIHQVS